MLPKARLTLVRTVSYQPTSRSGTDLSPAPHYRILDTEEQVWRRTFEVGPAWTQLPLGWLEGQPVSLIVLFNEEGRFTQTIPTPEARKEAMDRVVEIVVGTSIQPFTTVKPQQDFQFDPIPGQAYLVRCRTDKAKITLTAVPS